VNAYDLAANRASSDFDQRNLLNISYVYQLPFLRFLEVWRKKADCPDLEQDPTCVSNYGGPAIWTSTLLGGWSVSGITTYQSGTPFSVVNGASRTGISVLDNAGLALGLSADSYPDVASDANCFTDRTLVQGSFGPLLSDPCQFVAPRGLTQGNAGRNFLNNPGRTNFDVALLKTFTTWREMDVQFRAEAFNVFNHTQFILYDPNKGNTASNTVSCYGDNRSNFSASAPSCLRGSGFLHPIAAHRPRTFQFGVKLRF